MKRLMLVFVATLALVGAGLAVADTIEGKAAKSVSATFDATTATNVKTTTCKNDDGTFADTKGTYAGVATSSDPSLNGPIRIDLRGLINTDRKLGTVSGKLKITTASGKDTVAQFDGVYADGAVVGLASGHAQSPYSRLLANVSADYNPAGGLTKGKIGSAAGGGAVELTPGKCKSEKSRGETVEVQGTVSALSEDSITVANVTCGIPANLRTSVKSRVKIGDRVEMKCAVAGTVYTLVKIEVKKK